MGSRLPWIALTAGAYLAFLLTTFPAATAIRWFAPAQLAVAGVSGTIWSGSADLASVSGVSLRELRWRVRWMPLLTLRVGGEAQARLPNGFVETRFVASGTRTSLSDVRLSTDLASLAQVFPVSGASGLVSATLDSLVLEDGWPTELRGQVRISNLRVEPIVPTGDGLLLLGAYELQFQPAEPGTLNGTIRDLDGPLEVTGSVNLTSARNFRLEGQLRPRPDASRALVQGIELMTGDPDPEGRRAFTFTGSL